MPEPTKKNKGGRPWSILDQSCDRTGIPMKKGPDRTFDWEEAARLYQEGFMAPQLAKMFGVSEAAIYYALRSMRVARRRRGPAKVFDLSEIARLLDEGLTRYEVARRLSCCYGTVHKATKHPEFAGRFSRVLRKTNA